MDFSSITSLRYSITCSGAEFIISKHVTRTIDCIFAMETKSVRSASSASTAGSIFLSRVPSEGTQLGERVHVYVHLRERESVNVNGGGVPEDGGACVRM